MDKASKQKGETKKMTPVYSEEKLKALETAANYRNMISPGKNCRKLVISTKN